MVFTNAESRVPSSGYSISIIFALAGVTFLFVALLGTYLQSVGRDPTDAFDLPGQVAFGCTFLLLFAARLIFWSRSPPGLQSFVRTAMTALFSLTVILTAVTVVFAAIVMGRSSPHAQPIMLGVFTTFAVLCQIGAVIWLLRYRKE